VMANINKIENNKILKYNSNYTFDESPDKKIGNSMNIDIKESEI